MPIETLIALFGLAMAASWTPGPNTLMLAASGANFGLRRTMPHVMGIVIGFPIMMFAVCLGVGEIITTSPLIGTAMRWVGAALLLWFAYRTATGGRSQTTARSRPLTFIESAGFQWVNPKGWAFAIATATQFVTGQNILVEGAICALMYFFVGLSASTGWAAFGVGIRRLLSTDGRLRAFNLTMGAALAACALYLFIS
jgi:threonine/homoserine/homoserine lactone efflux protein